MRVSLIIIFCAALHLANGQTYFSSTTQFSTKDGLSSDKVYALHKDARGFIWIGTEEGLNRYDGKEFKVYSTDSQPGMSIRSIHDIFEDEQGWLWLLKKNETYDQEYNNPEINLLHIYTGEMTTPKERFQEDLPFAIKDIDFMKQLEDGSIYFFCSAKKEAFTYQAADGFTRVNVPAEIIKISDVLLQNDGHWLIKGLYGTPYTQWWIYKVDPTGKIIIRQSPELTIPIKDEGRISYAKLQGTNYVIGGFNLDAYNYYSPQLTAGDYNRNQFDEKIDQCTWNADQQLFWLKSAEDIKAIRADGQLVFQLDEKLDHGDIPILFDGPMIWLSDGREGIKAVTLEPNNFTNYRFFEIDFENSTRGIHQDKTGKTWVTTISGRGQIDQNGQIINEENGHPTFSPFQEDDQDNLWYFKENDLVQHHLSTNTKSRFHVENFHVSRWSFYIPSQEEVWLFGFNTDILKLDRQTGNISKKTALPTNPKLEFIIYEFLPAKNGQIWLCTNQGLYMLDADGNYLASYTKEQEEGFQIPSRAVHHFYEDAQGFVWLATGDAGLLKMKKTNTSRADQSGGLELIKQYTIADGLSSNALHAVYEDDFEYLWISSDNGLMQFDKRSAQITQYFTPQGIPHNEFNRIAHFQADDGFLYFGGLLGVTRFHPKNFVNTRAKKSQAPLVIADFLQFSGEEEQFQNRTAELLQDATIRLQPSDQFFNLKVALLDYQSSNKKNYQYRINGLYDWQSSTDGNLSISGLPYGAHQLEVKANNGNKQLAANDLTFTINVIRPYYLQAWFLILLGSAILLVGWYLIKKRTSRLLLQRETEQLKAMDQMKTHFFANIAHELRTPLTLIGLPLEKLMKSLNQFSQEEIMHYLQSAHANQQDLNQRVNEILDLSKLESGKLQVRAENILLHDFLERTVNMFDTSAASRQIQYRFTAFISEKLIVNVDQSKLEMVINNLLTNALKFTPDQGAITIHADWKANQELHFKVQDNGRGIHPEDLPHVFDRYFQTHEKDAAQEGGSGIGLAICKEFIELLGGKLQVASIWKEGSTFSFILPLQLGHGEPLVFEPKKQQPNLIVKPKEKGIAQKDQPTILVVEDHPGLRAHLQDILQDDYKILLAGNGVEALQQLEQNHCQLILSDVMMPEMDGFTFLERVKKDDRYCAIPFMLLTARSAQQDKMQGLRIGVDAYMHKPFAIEELRLRIKNLLQQAELRTSGTVAISKKMELIKKQLPKVELPIDSLDTPIGAEEMQWLQLVESIAQREIKNANYSVDDLAKELLMSRRQVFRKIKKMTGQTPKKYFNLIRLQKAQRLLEAGEVYTLTEVCYSVGFENTTHFANLYEAEFGKRPHDLLNKNSV